MNKIIIAFGFLAVLSSCQLHSQDYVNVQIPDAKAEAKYIWRNIQDITFFEKNRYQLALPAGQLTEKLKDKAREKQLKDDERNVFLCE